MRKILGKLSVGLILFVLFSCSEGGGFFGGGNKKFTGGDKVLRIANAFAIKTLDYRQITSISEANLASIHLECLFKSDVQTFTPVPVLVEKYSIDDNKRTLNIEIKKGIYFHALGDDDPIELTAEDVKFSFDLLCKNDEGNVQFSVIAKDRIAGAKEAYEESAKTSKISDVKGIKVTGKYSIEFQLLNSPRSFIEILTYQGASIISKKIYLSTGRFIGTGPFVHHKEHSDSLTALRFYKNVNYHMKDKKGNALPYLDSIVYYHSPNSDDAWIGFENNKFDIISYFPAAKIKKIVEENIASFKSHPPKYIVMRNMGFQIDYLSLNIRRAPFKDLRVRKAIAMSINKDLLIDRALYGQAYGPANYGFVPPVFKEYPTDSIRGISFNVSEAKKLLAEAGYKDGSDLGEVVLYIMNNRGTNGLVAAEIQRQLKENLNINITFESLEPHLKLLLQSQCAGNLYKDAWVADYPNPESFLMCFYSKFIPSDTLAFSYPNFTRYHNSSFDEYYEKGRDARNIKEAMHYFKKADEVLVNDVAAIPLWYNNDYLLFKSNLKNLKVSPLKIYNFAEIDKE